MHGAHVIKSWSSTQSVIALSSGEAEYYAMVKAATIAIGILSIMNDLGNTMEVPIRIHTDASAAIGVASRIGIGKVRHIDVTQLWLQEKVANKTIELIKVQTEENLADALTKAVAAGRFAASAPQPRARAALQEPTLVDAPRARLEPSRPPFLPSCAQQPCTSRRVQALCQETRGCMMRGRPAASGEPSLSVMWLRDD